MQIPCVYLPGPAPAVSVANRSYGLMHDNDEAVEVWQLRRMDVSDLLAPS
jgi:hypothetical protein